jgi:ribosomal protein S12 methylthiotransferase accessory factor YcaO
MMIERSEPFRQPPGGVPGSSGDRALFAEWCRHDWRESLFAPGLAILQALTRSGATASGAGTDRESALHRALGETAEALALARIGRRGFDPCRDGLAAHPDPARARAAALCEAVERRAVERWWRGEVPARPVVAGWLDRAGLTARLAVARRGAAQLRPTGWWLIDAGFGPEGGPHVAICRSTSRKGQHPILGFGCHPSAVEAAGHAMREALLMELNLMELLATRMTGSDGGMDRVAAAISGYARRGPAILPTADPVEPAPDRPLPEPAALERWLGARLKLRDLTPPGSPLTVWLCQPDLPDPAFPAPPGSPFL